MSLKEIKDTIFSVVNTMRLIDIVDILLLSYIVFLLLKLIRETRAGQLMKVILLLAVAYVISSYLGLKSVTYIISQTINI